MKQPSVYVKMRVLGAVDTVEVIEQVLAHERARVQVGEVEIGELGAEPFPQVVLGALGDPAQVAEGLARLRGHLRELLRAEDDEREHREDKKLAR